jgi:hypothetical protein
LDLRKVELQVHLMDLTVMQDGDARQRTLERVAEIERELEAEAR